MDLRSIGHAAKLHLAFRALLAFYEEVGQLPMLNDEADAEKLLKIAE